MGGPGEASGQSPNRSLETGPSFFGILDQIVIK